MAVAFWQDSSVSVCDTSSPWICLLSPSIHLVFHAHLYSVLSLTKEVSFSLINKSSTSVYTQTIITEPSSITDGIRCRDPQSSTRLSSGNSAEEREEGIYEQGRSWFWWKNLERHLTQSLGNSWILDRKLWSLHGTELIPQYVGDSGEASAI